MAIYYLKPIRRRKRWAKVVSFITTTGAFLGLFIIYVLYTVAFGN